MISDKDSHLYSLSYKLIKGIRLLLGTFGRGRNKISVFGEETGGAPEGVPMSTAGTWRVHRQAPVRFKARILLVLGHIANLRPPCRCVSAGCQGNQEERSLGFGLSGWTAAVFPPLHLSPLSSLSSVTGAAGGRRWVLCSLATPLVDGDWYAALFKCLSLWAREGDAWTKQALLKLPLLLLFAQAQRRGRTNISAQRNRDSTYSSGPESVTQTPSSSVKRLQVAPDEINALCLRSIQTEVVYSMYSELLNLLGIITPL